MAVKVQDQQESQTTGIKDWTVDDLLALKQSQLMKLYRTLPCPTLQEMEGEFRGNLLDTGKFWMIRKVLAHFALNSPLNQGKWLGKGFATLSEGKGHGYNSYKRFGKTRHVYPMKTKIDKSIYDGEDVFELDYTTYHSGAGFVNMIDEIRKVNDELYLGIGNYGWFKAWRRVPNFFALSGPREPYVGVDKQHRERRNGYWK